MSSVFKSIGRAFKRVTNVVKKVALPVLAVGAAVFTAGVALGLPAFAGGWGGAVSSIVGKLGAGSTLSNVLSGAVTQAGYGAALGGLVGGQSGMEAGALAGGLGGGLAGGMGYGTDILGGVFGQQPAGVPGGRVDGAFAAAGQNPAQASMPGLGDYARASGTAGLTTPMPGAGAAPVSTATSAPAAVASGAAAPTTAFSAGGFGKLLDSPAFGTAIAGLGNGLMAGMSAKAAEQARKAEQDRITGSYDLGSDARETAYVDDGIARPTPGEAMGYRGSTKPRYRYDPTNGTFDIA